VDFGDKGADRPANGGRINPNRVFPYDRPSQTAGFSPMARYDFRGPRLYVEAMLEADATVALERAQAHYLGTVLRLRAGDQLLVFNGRDGEWSATIVGDRRPAALRIGARTRDQTPAADLHYLFAPLKAARLDYMTQKAVEMGAALLRPVLTRHGQVTRVNTERMRANAIEAAEQCGILSLPAITPPIEFGRLLAERDAARWLVFCDEDAEVANPVAALSAVPPSPLAVLIGPEGGFAQDERAALLKQPNVVRLSLGPRILRADTAAVAALALVQAVIGDWRGV
jgi:16S rRNA (uracil1498-N3)-methyltransferase